MSMIRIVLGSLALVTAAGCAVGESQPLGPSNCNAHCWGDDHEIYVLSDPGDPQNWECTLETGLPFDLGSFFGGFPTFQGQSCLTDPLDHQTDHERMLSLLAEMELIGSAPSSPLTSDEAFYNTVVDGVRNDAYQNCLTLLTTSGFACTQSSREQACDQILNPLNNGGTGFDVIVEIDASYPDPTERLEPVGVTIIETPAFECEFQPDADTDGGTSGGGGTATTGGQSAPFGDIDAMVACSSGDCDVDQELVDNVLANFDQFYADGVVLSWVPADETGGPGVRLEIPSHTVSRELAGELELYTGDVIDEVNGVLLTDVETMLEVLHELSHDESSWVSLDFKIYNKTLGQCYDRTLTVVP